MPIIKMQREKFGRFSGKINGLLLLRFYVAESLDEAWGKCPQWLAPYITGLLGSSGYILL